MAYVDSKMARMREEPDANAYGNEYDDREGDQGSWEAERGNYGPRNRPPAGLGKLLEIDLGPDSTLRNIARTEAATRRLGGSLESETEGREQNKKVRLGRDGKPRRRRNRRTSDDIKRDKLVEEVLRESKREKTDLPFQMHVNLVNPLMLTTCLSDS
jgi:hypothetical protein